MAYLTKEHINEQEEAIFALRDIVWGKEKSDIFKTIWGWLFKNNPFKPHNLSCILALNNSAGLVAYNLYIFAPLKIYNETIIARWSGDIAVHPLHKGEGLKILAKSLDVPCYPCIAFPNNKGMAFSRLIKAKNIYIKSRICILDMPGTLRIKLKNKFISYFLGHAYNLFIACWPRIKTEAKDITIENIVYFDDRFDKFWQAVSCDYPIIITRTQKYLNWRFAEGPFKYRILAATRNGNISGYVVLRISEKGALKKGLIVDIFAGANDEKCLDKLLQAALSYFKENKCHAAGCMLLTNKKAYYRALRRNGILIPWSGSYFAGYGKDEKQTAAITKWDDWFLTLSDSDIELWN